VRERARARGLEATASVPCMHKLQILQYAT